MTDVGHLHGPLLRRWLEAIASERLAVAAATDQKAFTTIDARQIGRRLDDERDWVLDFSWPAGYDPLDD